MRRKLTAFVWLLAAALFTAQAEPLLQGRVISVSDGDTITLLDAANVQHKIRVGGIDAPDKGQAFGNASRKHIAELAFGKQAKADCYKVDKYKRQVCTVYVDGKGARLAQVVSVPLRIDRNRFFGLFLQPR